jgi:addiction module HigA family antidote
MSETELLPPIHPGEILLEEFLQPLEISQYRLAKDIGVPVRRINEIVLGKRRITADTALRLARYFGLSERFWMNLQGRYDLEVEKDKLRGRLEREVKVFHAVAGTLLPTPTSPNSPCKPVTRPRRPPTGRHY